jgi:hypothetical protein
MPMTESELRDFTEFAQRKLSNGGAASLERCLQEWRAERTGNEDEDVEARQRLHQDRNRLETHESLTRAIADMEAGRTRSLEESAAYTRSQIGCSSDTPE